MTAWEDDIEWLDDKRDLQSFTLIGGEALASQQINISAILLASVVCGFGSDNKIADWE